MGAQRRAEMLHGEVTIHRQSAVSHGIEQLEQAPKQTINATSRSLYGTSSFCLRILCSDGVDGCKVLPVSNVGGPICMAMFRITPSAEALFHPIFAPYTVSWRCDIASFWAI
jgi:hypothetical protein